MKKWLFLMLFAFGIAEVKDAAASTKDFQVGTLDSSKRTPGLICPRACNLNHGVWTGSANINPNPRGQSTCNCKVEGTPTSSAAPKPPVAPSTSSPKPAAPKPPVAPSTSSPKPAVPPSRLPTPSTPKPATPDAPKPNASGAKDVEVGPIWNQKDAQEKCPVACNGKDKWTGQWNTLIRGMNSVCNCLPGDKPATPEAPKPAVPAPTNGGSTKNISSGPIWNGDHAKSVCPKKCSDNNSEWKGVWWTPKETWGKDSICQCIVGDAASAPEAPKPTTPDAPKPDASTGAKPATPEAPKPNASTGAKPATPEAPKPNASTGAKDVEAGPIFNQAGAQQRCPVVCHGKDKWTGHWKTTVPGKMSVCNCLIGSDSTKSEAPRPTTPEAPKPTTPETPKPNASKGDKDATPEAPKPDASTGDKDVKIHNLNFDEGVDRVINSAVVEESTNLGFKKDESSELDIADRVALEIFGGVWDLEVTWEK